MLTQPRRFVCGSSAPFPIFYLTFIFITKEIRGLSHPLERDKNFTGHLKSAKDAEVCIHFDFGSIKSTGEAKSLQADDNQKT